MRDDERRAALSALAGDQAHITQAPLLLVWLVDLGRAHAIAAAHEAPTEGADFLESAVVGFVDAALAAQNAVLAAESLGLGTVYIGALRNRPAEVAELLHLPKHVFAAFGLVVGPPGPQRERPRQAAPAAVGGPAPRDVRRRRARRRGRRATRAGSVTSTPRKGCPTRGSSGCSPGCPVRRPSTVATSCARRSRRRGSSCDDHDHRRPLPQQGAPVTRALGPLTVSPVGLGGMSLTGAYGTADRAESVATVQRALELGVTFFDTADVYADGENERLLGPLLAPHRDQVVLATQGRARRPGSGGRRAAGARAPGHRREPGAAGLGPRRPVLPAPRGPAGAHRGDRRRARGGGAPRARPGTSACPRRRPRRSGGPTRCTRSRQCRASTRCSTAGSRTQVLPTLRELGIGFVPFSPLGRGILSGAVTSTAFDPGDTRARHERYQGDAFAANVRLARAPAHPRRRPRGAGRAARPGVGAGPG